MTFDTKRSAGLKGALALLFIALAGGGAFAFARRDAAPEKPSDGTAPITTGAQAALAQPAPCENKACESPTAPPASKAPAVESAPEKPAGGPAASLPAGEDRAALLELRKLAKLRTPTAATKPAADRLDAIARAALGAGEEAKKTDDAAGERAALSRAFFATLERDAKKPLRARLDELTQKTVFQARSGEDVYVVKSGDRLISIARAHKVAWSFLKRMNGLKTDSIRVGQKLRIPHGTVELAVLKTDFLLVATLDGTYLKAWDVGTGREDRTPESTFKIAERIEKPTWYAPDGKVYPFGEKENILGTRWMGFERTEQFAGFGIHGTALPETIGTESSAGCIRMRNEDVEEVYDLVPEGTIVTIVR
jgi:LysM repeat protein